MQTACYLNKPGGFRQFSQETDEIILIRSKLKDIIYCNIVWTVIMYHLKDTVPTDHTVAMHLAVLKDGHGILWDQLCP